PARRWRGGELCERATRARLCGSPAARRRAQAPRRPRARKGLKANTTARPRAGEGAQNAMPFCDAYISEGALSPSAERELLGRVTDLLLEHEGVDPTNEMARRLAWVFVHRHELYVAGEPAQAPHYRFVCQAPE